MDDRYELAYANMQLHLLTDLIQLPIDIELFNMNLYQIQEWVGDEPEGDQVQFRWIKCNNLLVKEVGPQSKHE